MMDWYDTGWGSGSWAVMAFMMVLWVGLLALAAWAAVHFLRKDSPTSISETPRATLDRRLATGEIDTEQGRKSQDLTSLDASRSSWSLPRRTLKPQVSGIRILRTGRTS